MGLTTVIFAGDADAATKASDEADRQLNLQQAIHSYGDVILTAGGAVREVSNSDLGVDVIADMLTITSGAGVSGIETSLDVIDSINNTNGDIILSDVDSIGESASGLTVNQITNTNGSVYINAPGSLDVLRINAPGASADITLHSGGVMNLLPVSGVPTTVTAGRNLIMSADGVLFLSSGFTAPNSVSFSSLADVKLSSTTLNLSTNEAITLQSNNSLIINGLLESAKGITLISNHGNVVMNGIIRGRNGQPLDSLTVIARGNLMTSGNYQGQYRFRSLIDDATYYGDAPELTGTSHVINATGQSVSNFESLNLVPFTTTGSAVAKDSATGMDIFRDPTDNQRYLRYISGQGEQFNRSNDPVTGYYPFSAVDLTTAQFIPLLYSTTADPKAGTLYAADKTTVIDPATVASFETELVPLTDSAVISRLVPLTQNDVSDSQPSGTSVTLINAAIGPVANSVTFIAQGQVQAPSLTLTGANSTISVLTSDNLTTGAWRAANITATSQGLFDSTGKFVGGNIIVPTSFKNSSNGNPKTVALTTLNDLTLDAPVSPTLSLLIHAGDAIVNPLSSITVGGAGSFIELASGSDLKITGDLTAAGPITLVSRGLSTGGGPLTGGSVIVSGNLTLGSGKLTVQTTDSDSEIFGTITGSGGLELLGTGVLTLDGTKTFGGQTTVTGGTLNVTGTTTASSPVVVSAGASLAGTGTVKGPVTVQNGGAIGPGPSVEQLTVNGNVSFAGGSNFAAKINGTTAITDYDQLNVLGTVTIGANVPLSLTSLNSFVPADGNAFLIISNDGNDPVVGTFMGLPEGAAVKNIFGSGVNASITYQGGTGNDVALLVDRTPPVVNSIVRSGTNPSKASSVNFVVTFSEPVTGVGVGDFVIDQVGVPQATIASVSGSGSTYTVTVNTGNGEGTLSIDFDKNADGSVQDAAGNLSVASFTAGGTFNVDTVLPRVTSIVLVNSNPTKAGPVAFTVTFNEPVTGLAANDFVIDQVGVTGATITNVTSSSGTTYTVTTTTGTGDGTLSIDFSATAGGGVQDAIGNTSTANFTAGENYIIDRTPPVVSSIVRANPNPTNLNSVDFTVTFNESVTGVGANDFVLHQTLLTGASITGISGSGTTYTVTVNSGTGEGSLWIDFDATAGGSVFDVALNMSAANFTAGEVYAIDKFKPTVTSITRLDTDPTKAATVGFLVTFNEIVTGVTTSNFVLDKTGLSAASIANVTGSGTTYTVTTNTGTADGTLSVDFLASGHNVLDSVSNISVANFTAGETYVVDHTPPVVTSIVRANPNPTNINSVNFTVTFSEPVTGVGMNDFVLHQTLLTSAAITGISGSGTTYTVTANTGTGEGTMWIDFDTTAGGGVFDAALNTSEVSFTTGQVYALDKLKPMVTSITRLDSSPTNAASLHFLVTFNEIVTGVTTNNFVLDTSGLSGAAITNLTGSGTTYTVTLSTGVSDGTLSIDFNAAGHNVLDSVNNISAVNFTPGEAYRVDTVPPIPTIQSIPDVQRVAVGPIAVTFNEPVTGVDISDFVLTRTPVGSGTPTTLTLTAGMLTGSGSLYSLNPISVTGIEGTYRLTLKSSGTGIIDFVGNASGGTSELWQFVSTQVVVTGTGNNKTLTITDNGGPSGASNSDDGITLSFVPGAPNMVRVSYEAAPGFAGVYEDIPVTGLANVVINTSTGNDTVTIDARNGGLPFVITFNGGVGGNDTLHVINFDSSFNAFTANYSNVNDGSIQLKSNGVTTTTISYTGLEPITIDGTPTEAIFNLPSTNDTDVVLSAMNANTFLLTGSTFEATAFSIGTLGSLTINSNSGNDKVTVASLPANFAGSLTVNGGDGNDTLEATSSQRAVTLLGGKGNDSLTGGGSDDSLSGGDGNDTLKAGAGNDTLSGGLGDDLLNGEGGIDLHAATVTSNVTITNTKVIGGGIGADTLLNLENVDFSGDSKNNLLDASQYTLGAVALHGLDGNDTLLGGTRSDLIDGGNGIDQINQTSVFTQTLSGAQLTGNGSDTLMSIERAILTAVSALGNTIDASAFNGLVTLNGGNGPDRLLSSIAGGVINGGSGKDTIIGGIGAERISGGADNDSITGGGGNDTIVGDSGNDTLDGGIGADVISGSDGRDMIFGGDGNDTIDGGTADDTISGDKGYDSIIGGIGNDAISGGDGNDYLDGQGGNDTLLGDAGSDTLRGGAGRDVCLGGDGADDIDGGADSDTVSGIRGVDLISTPSEIDNAFIFDFHKLLA